MATLLDIRVTQFFRNDLKMVLMRIEGNLDKTLSSILDAQIEEHDRKGSHVFIDINNMIDYDQHGRMTLLNWTRILQEKRKRLILIWNKEKAKVNIPSSFEVTCFQLDLTFAASIEEAIEKVTTLV